MNGLIIGSDGSSDVWLFCSIRFYVTKAHLSSRILFLEYETNLNISKTDIQNYRYINPAHWIIESCILTVQLNNRLRIVTEWRYHQSWVTKEEFSRSSAGLSTDGSALSPFQPCSNYETELVSYLVEFKLTMLIVVLVPVCCILWFK